MLSWMKIIMMAVPFVASLVKSAENMYTDSKVGAIKKQSVTDAISTVAQGMIEVSAGGQKETWKAIAEIAPVLIDPIVEMMNNTAHFFGEEDDIISEEKAASGGRSDVG